jgi:phage-related protein
MYQLWYTGFMSRDEDDNNEPILDVVFYKTEAGNEPVREWLKSLPREDRKAIGEDIKTAQYGWPLGMPLIRKMERGLWEVRSNISAGIARVLFTVKGAVMILLHGFVKKSQKTPPNELDTARRRLNNLEKD